MKKRMLGIGIILFVLINTFALGYEKASAKDDKVNHATFEEQIKNFGKKLTDKVPENYSREDALENGDITPEHITQKQREKINQFMANVRNNKPDFIRFVQFFPSGTLIKEYQFNGDLIYYRADSTRIKNSRDKVYTDYCKDLEKKTKPFEGTFLTNCYHSKSIEF
ncbi:DUF4362 domain-containing protein [Tuberibacillus sp. Marseille-P3662]|uniref:DUF4362 domain-containing protein n=1 Tax=Tuberibacillus sp. Marseille-P3662 TaxID=1965358 RepID=UPI000A1C8215|nr:DUF4362 domain-containing protein [Tuberibacillus sp. Marseille-P3662]